MSSWTVASRHIDEVLRTRASTSSGETSSTASSIVDRWAARFANRHLRATAHVRQDLCAGEHGAVIATWSGWVGSGNSIVRILTGALVAVALDKPFVVHTASVFDDPTQDPTRPLRRQRVFDATLTEAVSGIGGMPWLAKPMCIEEADSLHFAAWSRPPSATSDELRASAVKWCAEAGVTIPLSDVSALDLRHGPPPHASSHDVSALKARGSSGLCANASRIVVVHSDPSANFELLAHNRAWPPAALERLRLLTARGVNAYGLVQRALFPLGLTRVISVERPSVGVHLRCWMNACKESGLQIAATCLSHLLNASGPGCSIYVASEHAHMARVLHSTLDASIAARCAVLDAMSVALPPALADEVQSYERELRNASSPLAQRGGKVAHAGVRHDAGKQSAHPPAWAQAVDLALLSNAQAVVGVHSGSLSSTIAFVAGTRSGRFVQARPAYSSEVTASPNAYGPGYACIPASTLFPSSADASAVSYVYGTSSRTRAACD